MADDNNPPPPKATLSSLPASWKLTPEQEKEIFQSTILPLEITPFIPLSPPPSSPPPTAIILLGQTGSGKTRLAPLLSSSLSPSSPLCHLIADTHKTYHPSYTPCLTSHPHLASALTSPSARLWLTMACQSASSHRIPVLVESACRHPSDFSDIASVFSSAGYTLKVVILAVPAALSRLGVLVRYYNQLPESMSRGLPLRLTPTKVHDESYAGCVEGARWVDEHPGEVNQVVVVRRGGGVGYSNQTVDDGKWKWETEGRAREVLESQRKRGLSGEEREVVEGDLRVLEGLVNEGKAERETVEELRGLLKELDDRTEGEELKQLDIDAFVRRGGDAVAVQQEQQPRQKKSTKEILDEIEFDDDDDINFYNTCSCCR